MTEVSIRVSNFDNFGQHLGELERMSSETALAEPVDTAEIEKLTGHLNQLTKTSMEVSQKRMIVIGRTTSQCIEPERGRFGFGALVGSDFLTMQSSWRGK